MDTDGSSTVQVTTDPHFPPITSLRNIKIGLSNTYGEAFKSVMPNDGSDTCSSFISQLKESLYYTASSPQEYVTSTEQADLIISFRDSYNKIFDAIIILGGEDSSLDFTYDFGNGFTCTHADILSFYANIPHWFRGSEFDDSISGFEKDDTISGYFGDDVLRGNNGNDRLEGGQGNDTLVGGSGNDLYVFNFGGGQDIIEDFDIVGSDDCLRFDGFITADAIIALKSGDDLVLRLKDRTDQVSIKDYFAPETLESNRSFNHKINRIDFGSIETWDQDTIQTLADHASRNHAPVINKTISPLQAQIDHQFTYAIALDTMIDPDPWDAIAYSITMEDGSEIPSWLSFDRTSLTLSGTPSANAAQTLQLVLWAADNFGGKTGQHFTLTTVNTETNSPPVLHEPLTAAQAFTGAHFSYSVGSNTFSDPDAGDTLTYTARLTNGAALPSWLSFNSATGTFSGTPVAGDIGTLSVRVTARDNGGLTASSDFALSVQAAGETPDPGPKVRYILIKKNDSVEKNLYLAEVRVLDTHGNNLTQGKTVTSSGSYGSPGTEAYDWHKAENAVDGFSNINSGHGIFAGSSGGYWRVDLGADFSPADLQGIEIYGRSDGATDHNGQYTVYAFADPTIPSTLSNTELQSRSGVLYYRQNEGGATGQAIDLTLTMSQMTRAERINHAPAVGVTVAPQKAQAGSTYTFALSANTFSDPDTGDTLTYSATLANGAALPAWLSFNAVTGTFSGTPASGDVGTLAVRVTARDRGGLTAASDFTLNVQAAAETPGTNQKVRYILIKKNEGVAKNLYLAEVRVVDGHGNNLAQGKTVTSSGSYGSPGTAEFDWHKADNAVDGFSDISSSHGVFAGSSGGYWRVDLGVEYDLADLHNIEIYGRSDGATDHNGQYTVYAFADSAISSSLSHAELQARNGVFYYQQNEGGATGQATNLHLAMSQLAQAEAINHAPAVGVTVAPQRAQAGSPYTFVLSANTFSDPDAGDTLTYTATLTNGAALPSWLSFNPTTGAFSGTPVAGDIGTVSVRVTACDGGGLSATSDFALTVQAASETPDAEPKVRYILIKKNDGGEKNLYLAEVRIVDANGNNLAQGKTVTASSSYGSPGTAEYNWYRAENAVDGFSGITSSHGIFAGSSGGYWRVDLGADYSLTDLRGIEIYGRSDGATDHNGQYTVYAFADPTIPTTLTNTELQSRSGVLYYRQNEGGTTGQAINLNLTMSQMTQAEPISPAPATNRYRQEANADSDAVRSSVSSILGPNATNLILTGNDAIDGIGNDLDNNIIGNSANNTIEGGTGNDTLQGGNGDDTFKFNRGDGQDTIIENDATAGNTDVVIFGSNIAIDQLWFRHVGNDLEVSVIGTNDTVTCQNWYSGSQYHVEQFKTTNSRVLLDSQVEALVSAMATFVPPAAGQTTLPPNCQTAIAPVIAANWH